MTTVKFCGLTRAGDATFATTLGASHLGVIFAGGPRNVTAAQARAIFSAPARPKAVGVFGASSAVSEIADVAREVGLDVIQLHGEFSMTTLARLRDAFSGEIWAVLRCTDVLPADAASFFAEADAVLLDAKVVGRLGGTGVALPWDALRGPVERARSGTRARLVLAGGLTPQNVARAITALSPDVVDVSSGVESAPGIKDHERMRAFADAVQTMATAGQ